MRPWREVIDTIPEAAWHELACTAPTPNPFCERWFLKPSLEQFDPQGSVRIAILAVGGKLTGIMPIRYGTNYHGRFVPHLANWLHANSFCGEPLVVEGYSHVFWEYLLDWCDRKHRASLFLHLANLPTDGTAFRTLRELAARSGRCFRPVKTVQRAALCKGLSPQEHMNAAMEKKRRKELSRKRRRLEEAGELVFSRQTDTDALEDWIESFLALERAGWKGARGSSLSSAPETAALFREGLHGAARCGRLERLAFHLDGKPIAMLCTFMTPPISFGFKTAFDENHAKLSPGLLLQVENLAMLERGDIDVSDSCAAPGHPMIEQIWSDRREIAMVTVGIGGKLRRSIGAALSAIELRREEKRQ